MNANAPACPKKIEGKFNNYQEMTMNMGQKFLFFFQICQPKEADHARTPFPQADRLAQGLISS